MRKSLLICVCAFLFSFPIFAQNQNNESDEQDIVEEEQPMPQAPRKVMPNLESLSPELVKFQKQVQEINQKVKQIVNDYHAGKIQKQKAEEALRPLLKEQINMMNNPDLMVEQQIAILLSGN
jgi:hypothetical protein